MITAVGACTRAGEERRSPAAAPSSSAPTRPAFDPPRTFDTTVSVPLPDTAWDAKITLGGERIAALPILLDGGRAYVAAVDRLDLVDVEQGTVTATLRPTYEAVLSSDRLGAFVGGNPAMPSTGPASSSTRSAGAPVCASTATTSAIGRDGFVPSPGADVANAVTTRR